MKSLTFYASIVFILMLADNAFPGLLSRNILRPRNVDSPRAELNLKDVTYRIVYETYRQNEDKPNWELFMINADGSNPVNLTNTSDMDEMYPHVSPDGTKICFVTDEGAGRKKIRNVYYMNIDGNGRVKVAGNARQPCWNFDGKKIAYLPSEYERYNPRPYATAGLVIYDLQSGLRTYHPNRELLHIYALCWSPDENWFLAAVEGAMSYSDTILAFEANGNKIFDLGWWGVKGCRPDFNREGNKIAWGETDWNLKIGDIDLTGSSPRVTNIKQIVECTRQFKVYHVDFSPDGKYIAFSYGPFKGAQQVSGKAKGWNICVSDMSGKWVKITTDGNHNKNPDWVPISK
ncbi:MAG: PD40 domain-containing protein [Sedimentisphaerales bacterium]|nr:PD40 domain-containing protein [Sedimentisphaerales bacterium]